jgi:hypothetical protein
MEVALVVFGQQLRTLALAFRSIKRSWLVVVTTAAFAASARMMAGRELFSV